MILLPQDSWEIRKTGKIGRGVFATKDIKGGTIIGDYIGKVIKAEDEEDYDKDGHFYLMYYHDKAHIYPDVKKPGIHIINHACTPNTWMYTYKGHALYFAIRHIFAGEELTVSYQLNPQHDDCKPCSHLCHCESIICSGTMHMTSERYDKWLDFESMTSNKTKRERIQFNKTLPLLQSYPDSLPDDPIYTLFGNLDQKSQVLDNITLPTLQELRGLIRESGRTLEFPKLNIHILGIADDLITAKSISA